MNNKKLSKTGCISAYVEGDCKVYHILDTPNQVAAFLHKFRGTNKKVYMFNLDVETELKYKNADDISPNNCDILLSSRGTFLNKPLSVEFSAYKHPIINSCLNNFEETYTEPDFENIYKEKFIHNVIINEKGFGHGDIEGVKMLSDLGVDVLRMDRDISYRVATLQLCPNENNLKVFTLDSISYNSKEKLKKDFPDACEEVSVYFDLYKQHLVSFENYAVKLIKNLSINNISGFSDIEADLLMSICQEMIDKKDITYKECIDLLENLPKYKGLERLFRQLMDLYITVNTLSDEISILDDNFVRNYPFDIIKTARILVTNHLKYSIENLKDSKKYITKN